MNIVLGIIGAAVASWLMGFLGISLGGGWIAYLIAGFIGACIVIAVMWKLGENGVPALTSDQSLKSLAATDMIMFEIQYQAQGTDLGPELVACLLAHGSAFSRVGASGNPGAVQITGSCRVDCC